MENLDLISLQEGDNHIYTQEQVDKDKRVGTYDGRFLPKGGIYRAFVPFKEAPHLYKSRPVIIFSSSLAPSEIVEIIPITSAITEDGSDPNSVYEIGEYKFHQIPFFKYPILEWKENYLEDPSYAVIDRDKKTGEYYTKLDKKYILEPITAHNDSLMTESQFEEIFNVIDSLSMRENPFETLDPKLDTDSKYFDWETMGIPESDWKKYREDLLTGKIKKEKEQKISKYRKLLRNRLKKEFKNLRVYYLYDINSRSMGEQHDKIFKNGGNRKYIVLKDWNTYESYMGKYFPIISSMKDEIEDKFYSKLPTMNKEETIELKEHILSDEELRIFLDESL